MIKHIHSVLLPAWLHNNYFVNIISYYTGTATNCKTPSSALYMIMLLLARRIPASYVTVSFASLAYYTFVPTCILQNQNSQNIYIFVMLKERKQL